MLRKFFKPARIKWLWKVRFRKGWSVVSRHNSLILGIPIFVLCLLAIWFLGVETEPKDRWVEFWGLTFDVAVILIVVEFFRELRDRKNEISRHHDTIEDYKCWDSKEAGHRIGGALRRLDRLGETKFNLSGWKVANFVFSKNSISSIKGSVFYDARWVNFNKPSQAKLVDVDFSNLNCQNVIFSGFLFEASGVPVGPRTKISDCSFYNTDLRGANFEHAEMSWSNKPSQDQYEVVDENPDGSPAWVRKEWSPFYQADISGTSFRNVEFVNADFRDVENIGEAFFEGASGLENCFFDSNDIRDVVLGQAKQSGKPKG